MSNQQSNQQILRDLERHFATRLHADVVDIGSTSEHADIDIDDIIRMIVSGLLYELLWTASLTGWTEKDFLTACRLGYQTMMPHIKNTNATAPGPNTATRPSSF